MEQDRRSFLKRFSVGLSALTTLPFAGFAGILSAPKVDKKTILKIKPLGFQWETTDPFLFCVHHEDKFPRGNGEMGPAASLAGRDLGQDFIIKDGFRMYHGKKVPGFPGHPHRGFETITVVREGLVDHADSIGAAGRYGNGDVQWMTAGKGVQHSEMFPLIREDRENPLELFQIWLNLPAKNKMVDPHFKMFWKENISKYKHKDDLGKLTKVEVIAGQIGDHKAPTPPPNSWAADPKNEVAVWNIHLNPEATFNLPKTGSDINRTLYFYVGKQIEIGGKVIPRYHAVEVEPGADIQIKNGNHVSRILVLQGRPINEPVIQYGPFVMNSKVEIQQAFNDYNRTKFGGWPWPSLDQVHNKNVGRFALHADGRREER